MRSSMTAAGEGTVLDQIGDLIMGIGDLERQIAALRCEQARLVDQLDRRIGPGFPDGAREELMVACKITQTQARRRLDTARALARRLPHTRAALAAGRISVEHADAMAAATRGLDRERAGLVETEVLGDRRALTAGQLGWRAREAAARLVPPDLPPPSPADPVRALDAFWHQDGSVDFGLHLPAPDAAVVATWVRLVTAALRGRLAVRDQHCRFPGCTTHPRACRAHHITHWADGGLTDMPNLLLVCPRHHAAVHGGWTVQLKSDATVTWTSPTGQRLTCEGDLQRLVEPEDLTDAELGLDGPDTGPDAWIRPWCELLRHEQPPDPPPQAPEPRALSDVCPF